MLLLTCSPQHVEQQQPVFVFTFLRPSSSPNALPQCPLQQTKTNGIQRTTAAAVIDRDLYRGMSEESDGVVYCRSSPHICPVLLGSTSEQFSWERDMQVFFVFFPHSPTNRCIKLSRARQQTDGSVRCMKRKMFCSGPSCAFGREVFSAKCLNKGAVLHFLAKQSILFVLPSQWNRISRSPWGWRKNFSDLWHFA